MYWCHKRNKILLIQFSCLIFDIRIEVVVSHSKSRIIFFSHTNKYASFKTEHNKQILVLEINTTKSFDIVQNVCNQCNGCDCKIFLTIIRDSKFCRIYNLTYCPFAISICYTSWLQGVFTSFIAVSELNIDCLLAWSTIHALQWWYSRIYGFVMSSCVRFVWIIENKWKRMYY